METVLIGRECSVSQLSSFNPWPTVQAFAAPGLSATGSTRQNGLIHKSTKERDTAVESQTVRLTASVRQSEPNELPAGG